MGEATAANPLGLPVGEDGTIPQLRLTRLEGTESARRTAICTMVLDHLSENQAEGIFFFNALHRQHQVAAILVQEPGGTHVSWRKDIRRERVSRTISPRIHGQDVR